MDSNNSGIAGLLGIIVVVVLYFVLRKFIPSLASVLLVIAGIVIVLILLLVVFVIILAFIKPDSKAKTGIEGESAELMTKARSDLMEIRRTILHIKNKQINETGSVICGLIEKILRTFKEKPGLMLKTRQFVTYYLPTIRTILEKYARIEASGIKADETAADTVKHLADIRTALETLYEKLFDDDILNLEVETEVLKTVFERDGLLSEFDITSQQSDDKK